MKILITSGGTKVPIDDVRHIGNISSGKYGASLAEAFLKNRDEVIFFHERNSVNPIPPFGVEKLSSIHYKFYNDYLKVVGVAKEIQPDIIISAAAVSDYTVEKVEGKISSEDEFTITLKKAKKILPEFRKVLSPESMIVGFKLLVSPSYQEIHRAVQKVLNNGSDYVVFNDLTKIRNGENSRLVFKKDMSFVETETPEKLVDYLRNEYSTWPNGQRGL